MLVLAALGLTCQALGPALPAVPRGAAGLLVGGATVFLLFNAGDWAVVRRFLGGRPPVEPPP
jgi:hypothetical protein